MKIISSCVLLILLQPLCFAQSNKPVSLRHTKAANRVFEKQIAEEAPLTAARAAAANPAATQAEAATLRIISGGKVYELQAGPEGLFPEFVLNPKEKVKLKLALPGSLENDIVMVQILDGGFLEKNKVALTPVINQKGNIDFTLTADAEYGVYRVSLSHFAKHYSIRFWVAEPKK
jgi:hypothetical protein